MSNRHSSSSIGYQSNSESHTSYVFWCTTFTPIRLHNIWVTVSPRSLHPGTGTDSECVTRLTTYCQEHARSLANVVSTTPVRPPETLCHLTYMTLLTLTYSRNNLKLFCLIVHTDLLLLSYGAPRRFVEWRLTNLSLYCIVSTMAVSVAVCEIFRVNEWRDVKNKVRGRSRSLKMAPFDRPCTTFYRSAIVNIALSCTIVELFDVE